MSALAGDLRLETIPRSRAVAVDRPRRDLWIVFLLLFGAELAFGLWMDSRGINPNDAASRVSLALTALYGSDPHLSAIGFNWMPLPTFLELGTTALFPYWQGVVTTGFAFTAITAVAGPAASCCCGHASGSACRGGSGGHLRSSSPRTR